VLRASRDGVILYANAACAPLLETWGCGVGGTIPGEWPSWTAEALRSGARREVEIQADSRVYDCLLAPIADGGHVNVYGRDITSRKKLEKQAADANPGGLFGPEGRTLGMEVASRDPLRTAESFR
jgi:hypothetical protein